MLNLEDFNFIIDHYGAEAQIDKAIEELKELIEVLEGLKDGSEDIEHLAEELADVNIMMRQIRIMYDIPVEILRQMAEYKVARTLWRIKREGD